VIKINKKIAITIFFLIFFANQSVFATKGGYFSANSDRHFMTAEEFYKISGYKEVPKPEISARKLILAKDLPLVVSQMNWNSEKQKQAQISEVKHQLTYLSLQRQIYYFFSKKGNQKQGITKYALFDAETRECITFGKIIAETHF
jgi:hypothetical protein